MLMAIMIVPNVVNAYDATGYTCTNLELNPASISRTSWWVDTAIDAARLDLKPYNDSIRIVNQPCGQAAGGDEVARDIYNITQDANQIMTNFSVAFVTNGTFTTRFNYSILYAATPKGNVTYTENMSVTGTTGTWAVKWNTTGYNSPMTIYLKGGMPHNATNPNRNFTKTTSELNLISYGAVANKIYGTQNDVPIANCNIIYQGVVKQVLQCNNTRTDIANGLIANLTFYSRTSIGYMTTANLSALAGISMFSYVNDANNSVAYRKSSSTIGYMNGMGMTNAYTAGIAGAYRIGDQWIYGWAWKNGTSGTNDGWINALTDANADARPLMDYFADAYQNCNTKCGNLSSVQNLAFGFFNLTDMENDYQRNINPITVSILATPAIPDTTNSLLIYQYANMSNIDNHSIVWKLNIVVFNNDTTTLTNVVVDGANNFSIANYTIASLTVGASNLSQFAYNLTRENITTGGIDRVINLEPAKLVGNATGSSNALTIVNPVDPPSKLSGLTNCWTKDSIAKTIWIPIGCTFFWAATYFTS